MNKCVGGLTLTSAVHTVTVHKIHKDWWNEFSNSVLDPWPSTKILNENRDTAHSSLKKEWGTAKSTKISQFVRWWWEVRREHLYFTIHSQPRHSSLAFVKFISPFPVFSDLFTRPKGGKVASTAYVKTVTTGGRGMVCCWHWLTGNWSAENGHSLQTGGLGFYNWDQSVNDFLCRHIFQYFKETYFKKYAIKL